MAPVSATHNCSSQSSGLSKDTTFNPKDHLMRYRFKQKVISLFKYTHPTSEYTIMIANHYSAVVLTTEIWGYSKCLPIPSNFSDHNTLKLHTANSYPRLCSLHPRPTQSSTLYETLGILSKLQCRGKSWRQARWGEVRWPTYQGRLDGRSLTNTSQAEVQFSTLFYTTRLMRLGLERSPDLFPFLFLSLSS